MIKKFVLSISLFVSVACIAQEADSSGNDIDSLINKQPVSFAEEITELSEINTPATFSRFSGIRYVDVRAYTSCIGYIKLKKIVTKIIPKDGLIFQLNQQTKAKSSNQQGDSLIIYIKHFWITGIIAYETFMKQEITISPSTKDFPDSYCHLSLAYFIKNEKGLTYSGKTDSFYTSKTKIAKNYREITSESVTSAMEALQVINNTGDKYYTEKQVTAALSKPVAFPGQLNFPDGIFQSYSDFKKGNITKKSFTLTPGIDFYTIRFANPEDATEAGNNFWGICFKNNIYVRHFGAFCRLWKNENSFLSIKGFFNNKGKRITKIQGDISQGDFLSFWAEADLKSKTNYDFIPMLLNPLTGYLE